MKLSLDSGAGRNVINGYRPGCVIVNAVAHSRSLIVTPERIIADWTPQRLEAVGAVELQAVLALEPEIVLLGTGSSTRQASEALRAPFTARRIGFESMDTGAACRCYAVLASEGRRVAAALLIA
jgi:uncharacterized protein